MLHLVTKIIIFSAIAVECRRNYRRQKDYGFFSASNLIPAYEECECGLANAKLYSNQDYLRIIGGEKTRPHEFPWLVLIQYDNKTICGGSIISEMYVLSAAHCFKKGFVQEKFKVAVAQHDRCQGNNDVAILSVRRVIRNELFQETTYFADIMLLQLSMKLTFSRYIRPICLPRFGYSGVEDIYPERKGLVVGWGTTNAFSSILSCVPRKLALPIVPRDDCNATASTLFCAGFPEGGKDTCEGDSGGPFQIRNLDKRYELIGIVSSGIGCALPGNPGQYTDVTLFIPWILKYLSTYPYCW